jgi:hypothetical protein
MNFYEFTLLSDVNQFDLVFKEGVFIDFRETGDRRFTLYKLYSFFVEVQYEISQNKIVGKVVFQTN